MRKQIAAANWKMNLTWQQGKKLLDDILAANITLKEHQQTIFGVPAPYIVLARDVVAEEEIVRDDGGVTVAVVGEDQAGRIVLDDVVEDVRAVDVRPEDDAAAELSVRVGVLDGEPVDGDVIGGD